MSVDVIVIITVITSILFFSATAFACYTSWKSNIQKMKEEEEAATVDDVITKE